MPRQRRVTPPGTIQHVITRFRNKEFRIDRPGARVEYLRRLGESLVRVDWVLLAFAVMSSHIHHALLAGAGRIEGMMRSLNTGFGLWLNGSQGRTGGVFEGRYRAISVPTERAGELIAYLHNNPVRAGVVPTAAASAWTSHRAYLGLEPAPRWLGVERGLELAGFAVDARGRGSFDRMVRGRAGDERDVGLSGGDVERRRARRRLEMGGQVELCTERAVDRGRMETPVFTLPDTPLLPRWDGALTDLLGEVAVHTGVPIEVLRSRDRSRAVVEARRLALTVGVRRLGRAQVEVAACLGLSEAAASQLLSNRARLLQLESSAVAIALRLRAVGGA